MTKTEREAMEDIGVMTRKLDPGDIHRQSQGSGQQYTVQWTKERDLALYVILYAQHDEFRGRSRASSKRQDRLLKARPVQSTDRDTTICAGHAGGTNVLAGLQG